VDASTRIASRFLIAHPQDAARLCERLLPADVAELLSNAPAAAAAPILQHLTPAVAAGVLPLLPADRRAYLLEQLPLDLAASILRRMSGPERAPLLAALPEKIASALSALLRYPEHTAGALMDPAVLSLPDDIQASQARNLIRRSAQQLLYYVYVVNREHRLIGVLTLPQLLFSDPRELLAALMKTPVERLLARADRAAILAHPGWSNWHALPVVDEHEVLLGMIRYETFRRVQQEAAPNLQLREALGLALGMGELYWTVAAGLIESLTPAPQLEYPNGRETNGSQHGANDESPAGGLF
jgi:magnesium transporter